MILAGAAVFAVGLVLAWVLRPDLRAWLEQPKHRLHADLLRYDRQQAGESAGRSHRHD